MYVHCSVTSCTCLLRLDVKHAAVRCYDQDFLAQAEMCTRTLMPSIAHDLCQEHPAITHALY